MNICICRENLFNFVILIFIVFFSPVFSFAETNVNDTAIDTVGKIVRDKFNTETGLDKVKDLKDIDVGKIADKTVEYIRGDVPSQTMGSLIKQMRDVKNTGLKNNFRPYTKKTHDGNAPFRTENACQRIANQRHLDEFEIGDDYIVIKFFDGVAYTYTYTSARMGHVEEMKRLACAHDGFNVYINRHKPGYSSKK